MQSGSIGLDSQIISAALQVLGLIFAVWVGWVSTTLIRLSLQVERSEVRVKPLLDAIHHSLSNVPLSTNSPTEHEAELHVRYGQDEERRRMTDKELEKLLRFYEREQRDPRVDATVKLTSAFRQASVLGELDARERARRNPKLSWLWERLWRFRW